MGSVQYAEALLYETYLVTTKQKILQLELAQLHKHKIKSPLFWLIDLYKAYISEGFYVQ